MWRLKARASTGVRSSTFWKARDAKGFKARQTDVIDAEWLADLLRHGLLKASFIPPLEIRALRELTYYRESLVREQTALSNRIQKLIESGNIRVGAGHLGRAGREWQADVTSLSRRRAGCGEDAWVCTPTDEAQTTRVAVSLDRTIDSGPTLGVARVARPI